MKKRKRYANCLPWDWRRRLEIEFTDYGSSGGAVRPSPGEFVLKFRRGKTPPGFHRVVASLSVDFDEEADLPFVYSVSVRKRRLRRRGLGRFLYLEAIKHYGKLATTYYQASEGAQGVWRSLAREYKFVFDKEGYYPLVVYYKKRRKPLTEKYILSKFGS